MSARPKGPSSSDALIGLALALICIGGLIGLLVVVATLAEW